jgi:hypothetical protein
MNALAGLELGIKVERLAGLICSMQANALQVTLQCMQLQALLDSEQARTCDAVAAHAACAAVVVAMRAHTAHMEMQVVALETLRLLLRHTATFEVPMDAVVAAMRMYPKSCDLQHAAVVLLAAATHDNVEARWRAAQAGATDAVTAAMRAFPTELPLQLMGCQALAASRARQRTGAGTVATLDVVVAAMRAHARDAQLQEFALCALQAMDLDGPEALLHAPLQRALDAAATALHAHDGEAVAHSGCAAVLSIMARVRRPPDA